MAKHFNLNNNLIVNRLQNGFLHAQCSHLSTFQEASAWLSVDTRNFRIKSAGLEVYHSLYEKAGYTDLHERHLSSSFMIDI